MVITLGVETLRRIFLSSMCAGTGTKLGASQPGTLCFGRTR